VAQMSWTRQTEFIDTWVNELDMIVQGLNLPGNVLVEARRILMRAVDKELTLGRKASCVALSSLYLASGIVGVYVPISRLLASPLAHGVRRGEFTSLVRMMMRELDVPSRARSLTSKQYLAGIVRLLVIDGQLDKIRDHESLLKRADQIVRSITNRSGPNPAILAAASLYVAAEEQGVLLLQRGLAKAAGSSDVALRTYVKMLKT